MTDVDRLIAAGRWQSGICTGLAAPTWAAVIDHLLADVERGATTAPVELLLADPGDPLTSNVWLRLLGSVHRLVLDAAPLRGEARRPVDSLAGVLASVGGRPDPTAAPSLLDRFVAELRDEVAAGMGEPVQTKEVMRSAPLSAGLNWLGGDVMLLEVGASAGLNLWLDRYRVETPGASWGPPDATLTLRPDVVTGTPPTGRFDVVSRRGCDRRPLDPTSAEHRRLLRSFVWPDHVDRLERLDRALASCGAAVVERGDATGWIEQPLAALGVGRTVLFHSIVMPYLSDEERLRFETVIASAGDAADDAHRLAWMRIEPVLHDGRVEEAELVVTQWPERTTHRLARLTPHATSIRWHPELVAADG